MSYTIKENLKLHGDTNLDNASLCKELQMHSNLVEFSLESEEENMSSNILARLTNRSSTIDTQSSSSTLLKKIRVDQIASSIRILHPYLEDRDMLEHFFKRLCSSCFCEIPVSTIEGANWLCFSLYQGVHKVYARRFYY